MAVLGLLLYIVSDAVGFAVGYFLPVGPWTPYAPLLVAYHLFLIGLVVILGISEEQKIGISLGIPMTIIGHIAFLGALVGVVFMREYVPLFSLVRYALPALAPFEAKWLFEGKKKAHTSIEPQRTPKATQDEYSEFLVYLRQKDRRFQRPGRSVQEEFKLWQADRAKKRAQGEQAARSVEQAIGTKE
jgi:hypothetical protein